MNKMTLLTVLVGILLLVSGIQAIELRGIKEKWTGGNTISAGSGGETQAEMMARMHPDQVSGLSSLPNQVGGC